MGAAASLADEHLECELTLAEARKLVPAGTWDARWDGQFAATSGTMTKSVAMMLLARVEQLGAAGLDWGDEVLPPAEAQYVLAAGGVKHLTALVETADAATPELTTRCGGVVDASLALEASLRARGARSRPTRAAPRRGPPCRHGPPRALEVKPPKRRSDASFFYECIITKLDDDKRDLQRQLAEERARVAWMDASCASNAAKAARAVARKNELKDLLKEERGLRAELEFHDAELDRSLAAAASECAKSSADATRFGAGLRDGAAANLKLSDANRDLAAKLDAARASVGGVFDVRFRGNPSKAFAAEILGSNDDGTFDVRYRDGDVERSVPAAWMTLLPGGACAVAAGDCVEARHAGKPEYVLGLVDAVDDDGLCDVHFPGLGIGGTDEAKIPRALVEARGGDAFEPGVVKKVDESGDVFDVAYLFGEGEAGVARDSKADPPKADPPKADPPQSPPSPAKLRAPFATGDACEARYQDGKEWWPGVVAEQRRGHLRRRLCRGERERSTRARSGGTRGAKDHGDGAYDVSYEDGDAEVAVPGT
ncbi:tudor domain-containing protein [Aureococcus anophagefferens]|nr:tudor domain-containing protein [Aureococcus anophagefferens]